MLAAGQAAVARGFNQQASIRAYVDALLLGAPDCDDGAAAKEIFENVCFVLLHRRPCSNLFVAGSLALPAAEAIALGCCLVVNRISFGSFAVCCCTWVMLILLSIRNCAGQARGSLEKVFGAHPEAVGRRQTVAECARFPLVPRRRRKSDCCCFAIVGLVQQSADKAAFRDFQHPAVIAALLRRSAVRLYLLFALVLVLRIRCLSACNREYFALRLRVCDSFKLSTYFTTIASRPKRITNRTIETK